MKRKRFKKLVYALVPHVKKDDRAKVLRMTRDLPTLRTIPVLSYAELWEAFPGWLYGVGVKHKRSRNSGRG